MNVLNERLCDILILDSRLWRDWEGLFTGIRIGIDTVFSLSVPTLFWVMARI